MTDPLTIILAALPIIATIFFGVLNYIQNRKKAERPNPIVEFGPFSNIGKGWRECTITIRNVANVSTYLSTIDVVADDARIAHYDDIFINNNTLPTNFLNNSAWSGDGRKARCPQKTVEERIMDDPPAETQIKIDRQIPPKPNNSTEQDRSVTNVKIATRGITTGKDLHVNLSWMDK